MWVGSWHHGVSWSVMRQWAPVWGGSGHHGAHHFILRFFLFASFFVRPALPSSQPRSLPRSLPASLRPLLLFLLFFLGGDGGLNTPFKTCPFESICYLLCFTGSVSCLGDASFDTFFGNCEPLPLEHLFLVAWLGVRHSELIGCAIAWWGRG